ncbi:hypothetical protein H2201_006886 [Coniosporium apollinis]|uniref:Uncharacterized protein n=1 Tax=Coniosporium apollinis TaxID=61459 RepID=A0ABQ9NR00_9PEZI|nr:hypothetical protein H2201_006886 [Coniosporium apollinis]
MPSHVFLTGKPKKRYTRSEKRSNQHRKVSNTTTNPDLTALSDSMMSNMRGESSVETGQTRKVSNMSANSEATTASATTMATADTTAPTGTDASDNTIVSTSVAALNDGVHQETRFTMMPDHKPEASATADAGAADMVLIGDKYEIGHQNTNASTDKIFFKTAVALTYAPSVEQVHQGGGSLALASHHEAGAAAPVGLASETVTLPDSGDEDATHTNAAQHTIGTVTGTYQTPIHASSLTHVISPDVSSSSIQPTTKTDKTPPLGRLLRKPMPNSKYIFQTGKAKRAAGSMSKNHAVAKWISRRAGPSDGKTTGSATTAAAR